MYCEICTDYTVKLFDFYGKLTCRSCLEAYGQYYDFEIDSSFNSSVTKFFKSNVIIEEIDSELGLNVKKQQSKRRFLNIDVEFIS